MKRVCGFNVSEYRGLSVCLSVCQSVTLVSPAKTAEAIELPFALRTRVGSRNHVLHGSRSPHGKGQLRWIGAPIVKYRQFLPWAVQKRLKLTDQFAVWAVDSSLPKDAQVQSYSPGGTNVQSWDDTLPSPCEYDRTIRLRRRCALCQITLITSYLWTRPLRQLHK